jgi:hypothetical protein
MPEEIVLVTKGIYAECTVLAGAENEDTAQKWADRWNLDHMRDIRVDGDEARVGDRVPYIAAGSV